MKSGFLGRLSQHNYDLRLTNTFRSIFSVVDFSSEEAEFVAHGVERERSSFHLRFQVLGVNTLETTLSSQLVWTNTFIILFKKSFLICTKIFLDNWPTFFELFHVNFSWFVFIKGCHDFTWPISNVVNVLNSIEIEKNPDIYADLTPFHNHLKSYSMSPLSIHPFSSMSRSWKASSASLLKSSEALSTSSISMTFWLKF